MRKRVLLAVAALLLLMSVDGWAQDFIRYYPPAGVASTGGTLTGPLLLPNGSVSAPSLGFSSNPGYGIWFNSGTNIDISLAGTRRFSFGTDFLGCLFNGCGIYLGDAADTVITRDAANTLALRKGGTAGVPVPQTFNVYNFCDGADCATGYERVALRMGAQGGAPLWDTQKAGTGTSRGQYFGVDGTWILYVSSSGPQFQGDLYASSSDSSSFGLAVRQASHVFVSRSIQGSKSKALTDNTATAFVRLSVADDDYEGCGVIYTAYAEDTATDARQTRTGSVHMAILNNSGTETAAFSTGDSAVVVTAGTFTCTFDGNSGAADTIDLRATCDTSLAATTTLTFEYRLDCPSTVTVTPQ